MTQPVWTADWHAGMFWKVPPTGRPVGTWTLPPRMMADTTSLRRDASGSIWLRSSRISMAAPWEWPMKTTGLPSLSCAR